jgi:signal transduction histidine kinase
MRHSERSVNHNDSHNNYIPKNQTLIQGLQNKVLELNETVVRLSKLSEYLQDVREQEKTNVSTALHDEIGQALVALKMNVSWIKSHLDMDQTFLAVRVQDVLKLLDSTLKATQRISRELRPGILDIHGLAAALEWQAKEFEKNEGVSFFVRCDGEELRNKKFSTVLFRAFQEILSDIRHHEQVSKVEVHLNVDKKFASLKIWHDGKRGTKTKRKDKNSLDTIALKERISFLKGKFDISEKEKNGTFVKIYLPLEGKKDD